MKYIIILGILLSLQLSATAIYSSPKPVVNTNTKAEVHCIDNYKFLVIYTQQNVTVVQMYSKPKWLDHPPQPMRCE